MFSDKLISLKGSPNLVNGSFHCESNKLVNFIGLPLTISQSLYAENNFLKSLDGLSSSIGQNLSFINNPELLLFNKTFSSYKELKKESNNLSQIEILNQHQQLKEDLSFPIITSRKKQLNKI